MKKILFITLLSLSGISQINMAMIVVVDEASQAESNSDLTTNIVNTEFGLSGTIDAYKAEQSLIIVDGISYVLDGMGSLIEADLVQGQKIKFNLEKSSSENHGHITKIWLTQE